MIAGFDDHEASLKGILDGFGLLSTFQ